MSKLAHNEFPASVSLHNGVWCLEVIGKSKRQFRIATLHLKRLISTSGYLLTLAVSLGLWYGIYAAISTTIPDNEQNYANEHLAGENMKVDDTNVFFTEFNS